MEIAGDLQSLVCPLLGHGVRELAEDLLTLGEFDVSLLERLGSEEHLSCEDQGRQDRWKHPKMHGLEENGECQPKDAKPQIADQEVADVPDCELSEHLSGRNAEFGAHVKRHEAGVDCIVRERSQGGGAYKNPGRRDSEMLVSRMED